MYCGHRTDLVLCRVNSQKGACCLRKLEQGHIPEVISCTENSFAWGQSCIRCAQCAILSGPLLIPVAVLHYWNPPCVLPNSLNEHYKCKLKWAHLHSGCNFTFQWRHLSRINSCMNLGSRCEVWQATRFQCWFLESISLDPDSLEIGKLCSYCQLLKGNYFKFMRCSAVSPRAVVVPLLKLEFNTGSYNFWCSKDRASIGSRG